MIELRKVQTANGRRISMFLQSKEHHIIDAEQLVLFPALIDPHVHFRTPGAEYKESWATAAKAAIAGGVTTVFDMPNNTPACTTKEALEQKKGLIDAELEKIKIPLRYYLYLGADQRHLEEIERCRDQIAGIKIYMGSSTGDLLMNDPNALDETFGLAAKHDLLVVVHAENEHKIQERKKTYQEETDPSFHSKIRSPEVAAEAVEQAIHLAEKHETRLYIAHVSTKEELFLIRRAKDRGLSVYAEVTPHHLFLNDLAYEKLGSKALVNPPLRSQSDVEALWSAIEDQTIDTIGTDHAPHTLEEKLKKPFDQAPSGFPSIELYLPLLLNAYHEKKLSFAQIISLTHTRPKEIFRLPANDDVVLVDLDCVKQVEDEKLHTKAKWSPYNGWTLKGWPRYTIANGELFDIEKL